MPRIDELRLMAKVARTYHTQDLRQMEIVERLKIHQSTVSRYRRFAGIARQAEAWRQG